MRSPLEHLHPPNGQKSSEHNKQENEMSDVMERIDNLVKNNNIVLFMKGTPAMPQCGFSARSAGILSNLGADFQTVDVLADPEVRQGIKQYQNWPTIPQLYIGGELIGGSDIMMQLFESGELAEKVNG
jgi:monothiol glutaredoxin